VEVSANKPEIPVGCSGGICAGTVFLILFQKLWRISIIGSGRN